MTNFEILLSVFCVFMGVLIFVSHQKNWAWYMDNYQSRPMRESFGETGFAIYTYALCAGLIGLGAYLFTDGFSLLV